ncbi:sulfurtransferase, partial [bacterium]|nr:sulfurtransferase [bacterium]
MLYTTIVTTEILAQHLRSPDWIIIDCRFDLANPNWGRQEYLNGHIPGAFFADLDRDL